MRALPALLLLLSTACLGGNDSGSDDTTPMTCEELQSAFAAELADLQACDAPSDCGQVLEGTSCGCTRNAVARLDADDSALREIMAQQAAAECDGLVSTCDCPAADGFDCVNNVCTWNYE